MKSPKGIRAAPFYRRHDATELTSGTVERDPDPDEDHADHADEVDNVLLEVERSVPVVMLGADVDDDVQRSAQRHDEQPRDYQYREACQGSDSLASPF
jgi:hypothetical protein